MTYNPHAESIIQWHNYQENHILTRDGSGLLFVRVAYCWTDQPNHIPNRVAPGVFVLGFCWTDPHKLKDIGPGPYLQRVFLSDTRGDEPDNLQWEDSAAIAKPGSLVAGSVDYERPKQFERAHVASAIIHRKWAAVHSDVNHSRRWNYSLGQRPKRYDIPAVYGWQEWAA